jgi:hypothetical protein
MQGPAKFLLLLTLLGGVLVTAHSGAALRLLRAIIPVAGRY